MVGISVLISLENNDYQENIEIEKSGERAGFNKKDKEFDIGLHDFEILCSIFGEDQYLVDRQKSASGTEWSG